MAKAGKQPGAGRPKGSITRPQLRDYFTEEERLQMVEMIKTHMVDDMQLLRWAGEQIFGKAPQTVDITTLGESLNGSLSALPNDKLEELSAG